jgi:hypothetical protein
MAIDHGDIRRRVNSWAIFPRRTKALDTPENALKDCRTMSIEARVAPFWKTQRLIPALICIGYAAYYFFDGAVGYRRSNVRWLEHQRYADAHMLNDWPARARELHWNPVPPEKFHTEGDIRIQFIIGGFLLLTGGTFLWYWFDQKDRILRADDEAIYTPSGTRVPYEAVTSIERKKWEAKGLASVRYSLDGRKGEFVIDDAKFDGDATHEIFDRLEERFLDREDAESG